MIKLILFLILLSTFATATPILEISPTMLEAEVNRGTQKDFTITLSNTGDLPLHNLTFTSMNNITIDAVEKIDAGQTITHTVKVRTADIFEEIRVTTASFVYYITQSLSPTVKNVYIDDICYTPRDLVINQGDTVIWHNNGTTNHTVTFTSFEVDVIVEPSNNFLMQFDTIQNITCFDRIDGFTSSIEVKSNYSDLPIRADSLNKILTINIKSTEQPTQVNLLLVKNLYSIRPGDKKQLAIELVNVGDNDAQGINISMPWLNVTNESFTLEEDKSKYFFYDIIPNVTKTEETNKTYTFHLKITGSNFGNISKNITIYVPHQIIDFDNLSNMFIISRIELSINQSLDYCTSEVGKEDERCLQLQTIVNHTVFQDTPSQFDNVTNDELWTTLVIAKETPEQFEWIGKRIKEQGNLIGNNTGVMKEMKRELIAFQLETGRLINLSTAAVTKRNFWLNFWGWAKALFVVALIGIGIFLFINWGRYAHLGKKKKL